MGFPPVDTNGSTITLRSGVDPTVVAQKNSFCAMSFMQDARLDNRYAAVLGAVGGVLGAAYGVFVGTLCMRYYKEEDLKTKSRKAFVQRIIGDGEGISLAEKGWGDAPAAGGGAGGSGAGGAGGAGAGGDKGQSYGSMARWPGLPSLLLFPLRPSRRSCAADMAGPPCLPQDTAGLTHRNATQRDAAAS